MTEILQDPTIATTTDFTASKTLRGFALMDENRLREVSQKGLLARRGPPVGDTVGLVAAPEEQPAVL
jgi:hypothetical protein